MLNSKFELVKEVVGFLAQLASLAAFAFAVYAFYLPETVSDYMQRVAQVSESIDKNVTAIADSSEQTSEHTGVLAEALPEWFQVYAMAISRSCPRECEISVVLDNSSRFSFSGTVVKIFSKSGQLISETQAGWIAGHSLVQVKMKADQVVSKICVVATIEESGATYQDLREVIPYGSDDASSSVIELKYEGRELIAVSAGQSC